MTDWIPAFDPHRVFVEPWTVNVSLKLWIVVMGFLVLTTCGWVGQYLILRRMALMGDAISHSILPGLAGSFLIGAWWAGNGSASGEGGARGSVPMFLGALVAAVITTVLIEWIHRRSRVKQDAAMGTVFSALFALGVVLITVFADHVDLDADCVLHGEIGFVPFEDYFKVGGREWMPVPVARMLVVSLLTAAWIGMFYKELLVSSFDPGLATSLGISAQRVHFLLMAWLAVVIVSAFESVGAILVVAALIVPGATATLLSSNLPRIFLWITLHAAVSALAGLHLAVWLDCSIAGAMVVAGCALFVLAWAASSWSQWRARRLMATGAPPEPEERTLTAPPTPSSPGRSAA
ncbi:MAG: metal ABC transporter permease [Verrucomicrobiales bacterium]|nr:metal ABC transporter permease [Verrucomicrobiales bacterium]